MSAPGADNPYAAPVATVTDDAGIALPIEYAGKWRRFFNWLIDRAVLYALTVGLLVLAVIVDGEQWADWYDALGFWRQSLIGMILMIAYYAVMEGLFGVSVGKLMTGTRVVNKDGRAPTLSQAAVRSLCRCIPFDALSVAFSEDGHARGWHDSIARTYVVRRRKSPKRPNADG